jgi:hypothetical protein
METKKVILRPEVINQRKNKASLGLFEQMNPSNIQQTKLFAEWRTILVPSPLHGKACLIAASS